MLHKLEITLRETVEALMHSTKEDAKKVRDHLISSADSYPSMRAELLKLGADQAVRNYFQAGRRQNEEERQKRNETHKKGRKASARKAKRLIRVFWDRYSLFGHMLLGDATAKDLRASASKRIAMAAGNQRAADFELALMNGLRSKPNAKVRDFYSPAKVAELAAYHKITK